MQRQRGAKGLTVATLVEAETLAGAGFDDLTHAFPLDPGKITPALDLADKVLLRLTVDDRGTAEALESAAGRRNQRVHVWLKVDCGYHRAGVDPSGEYAVQLARFLDGAPHIIFDGLLTHAGHAYKAGSREELETVAVQERDAPVALARRLCAEGTEVAAVSIGSTPTVSVAGNLEGVTEIRPGNYVFHDLTQIALGSCRPEDCALTVLATVVSHQPGGNHVVIDAGALALSHDPGPVHLWEASSRGAVVKSIDPLALHPELRVDSLSQEHGIIRASVLAHLEGLDVGSKVRIVPNHACLTAALFDEYVVVRGDQLVDRWPIMRTRT